MQLCPEAEGVYLDHEASRLLEDIEKFTRILAVRYEGAPVTGWEAYDLSCLTGCEHVYATDPYVVTPEGITWRLGLEDEDSGDKPGIFKRFFRFIGNIFKAIWRFFFGGKKDDEGNAGAAAQMTNVIKTVETIATKMKACNNQIKNCREKGVKLEEKITDKSPLNGIVKASHLKYLFSKDIVAYMTSFSAQYSSENISKWLEGALLNVANAATNADNGNVDKGYQRFDENQYNTLVDALAKAVDNVKNGSLKLESHHYSLTTGKNGDIAYLDAKPFSTEKDKRYNVGDTVTIYNGLANGIPSVEVDFIENPLKYINVDALKKFRADLVKQGQSFAKTAKQAASVEKQVNRVNVTSESKKAMTGDMTRIITLANSMRKTIYAMIRAVATPVRLYERFTQAITATVSRLANEALSKAPNNENNAQQQNNQQQNGQPATQKARIRKRPQEVFK